MVSNAVVYFEIPVQDMNRAILFYEAVFDIKLQQMIIDDNEMALFSFEGNATGITGALAKGDSYIPGKQGARVYFHTEDIDSTMAKALLAGGAELYPKTSVVDWGWVAEFEDSEGNCIALHQNCDSQF